MPKKQPTNGKDQQHAARILADFKAQAGQAAVIGDKLADDLRRAQLHQAARDAQLINRVATAFVTAGGETLKEQHGFTAAQLEAWASVTIAKARGVLGIDNE